MARADLADHLVEAAALLVQERGGGAIALCDLAAVTGMDEADVRAVFPTDADLHEAVATRMYAAFLDAVAREVGEDDTPGAFTRAYLRAVEPVDGERDDFTRLGEALLASGPYRPELVEAVRREQATLRSALEGDGIDPVLATIVRLAADGLWMNALFRLDPVTPGRRAEVVARLEAMTRMAALPHDGTAAAGRNEEPA